MECLACRVEKEKGIKQSKKAHICDDASQHRIKLEQHLVENGYNEESASGIVKMFLHGWSCHYAKGQGMPKPCKAYKLLKKFQ